MQVSTRKLENDITVLGILRNMEVWSTLLLFLSVLTLIYLISGKRKQYSNLPPGPRHYPFIGNILQLAGRDFREVFREYRVKYGPIFTVRIFSQIIIVVNGYENLKNVFVKHGANFSERPDRSQLGSSPLFKGKGIIFSKGEIWKHNRRFALHTLRDFGMGKCLMQMKIHEEILYFLDIVEKQNGKLFDVRNSINMAVSNVISSVVFGKRFDYNNREFLDYLHRVDEIVKSKQFFIPIWLRYIPGDPFRVNRRFENVQHLITFYTTKVREHLESFDASNIRDLIDAYIKEMKRENATEEASLKNEDELLRIVHDLFIAGTDTTTTVLRFGLLYLLRNPDVQTKVFNELRDVIPNDRAVEMNDKKHLPYTTATISEILRLSNIVPLSIPHAVKVDTQYNGYTIPASALIIPNLESVAMDDEMWDDPFSFNPSRFLDKDSSLIRTEEVIPFSLGPRTCAGEALGRMEIFLFLTAMVQHFEFVLPEGEDAPGYKGKFALIVDPTAFSLRAVRRVK